MTEPSPVEILSAPQELPCGISVKNRFFKSAMSEALGTVNHRPTPGLCRLYEIWALGGTGVSVTGNVMVDRTALGEPRNVVLDKASDLVLFEQWAVSGKKNDTQLWMQLNHPGKQSPKFLSPQPVAPSAIPLGKGLDRMCAAPRALEEKEIETLIRRFAVSAGLAKAAGFTGVQIHAAHGYLVSQFLSPHHNRRTDKYGGSAANRMRFVSEIYAAIRAEVGDGFPVSIKLNSADFQRGGFSEEESIGVIESLDRDGIDLVEISGGNYENPAMTGASKSTLEREAYFLEFAEKLGGRLQAALVVTGGFRTAAGMADSVGLKATDLVGLARPLALVPDLPQRILDGKCVQSDIKPIKIGIKAIDRVSPLEVTWYEEQLRRLAQGKQPDPNLSPGLSLVKTVLTTGLQSFQRRRLS